MNVALAPVIAILADERPPLLLLPPKT